MDSDNVPRSDSPPGGAVRVPLNSFGIFHFADQGSVPVAQLGPDPEIPDLNLQLPAADMQGTASSIGAQLLNCCGPSRPTAPNTARRGPSPPPDKLSVNAPCNKKTGVKARPCCLAGTLSSAQWLADLRRNGFGSCWSGMCARRSLGVCAGWLCSVADGAFMCGCLLCVSSTC